MANVFAPNGFSQYQGTGSNPTYEQTQLAISSSNTTPIFFGDPVVQAATATTSGASGVGTGYIQQGYGPVTLTVGATALTTNAAGSLVITFTGCTSTSGNVPASWQPPIGSTITVTGSTTASGVNLNGTYQVTSATGTGAQAGTVTCNSYGPQTPSVTSTASGTITVYVPIAGIFVGCKYLSVAQKRTVWSNYWPGSDANTASPVTAYVITDPNAQFSVQTANSNVAATAVGVASIGQNIGFNYNDFTTTGEVNGNTANGLSTFFADQYSLIANSGAGAASNNFLPFRIIAVQNYTPDGSNPLQSINGNDYTSGYNRIVVGFNNSMQRGLAGI